MDCRTDDIIRRKAYGSEVIPMQEILDIMSVAGIIMVVAGLGSVAILFPEIKKQGTRKINVCIEKADKWKISECSEAEWLLNYLEKGEL